MSQQTSLINKLKGNVERVQNNIFPLSKSKLFRQVHPSRN
jgi:hypothetical protein